MIKIYHNNRCSKSRCGLQILEESGKDFEIVKYLEDVPSVEELTTIINQLKMQPIDLVRKNEPIWKSNYNSDIIKAMVDNPKLIERPIVINGNKAVIGRPPERILDII